MAAVPEPLLLVPLRRFDAALTETGSGFDRYLASAEGWAAVRRTPKASFYRRLDGPHREHP